MERKETPGLGTILFDTLSIQSKSGKDGNLMMNEFITRTIQDFGLGIAVEIDDGNIYATKGESDLYPCVVAHTDTVHKIVDDFIVTVAGHLFLGFDLKTGRQVGVGGDDKVGVAIALAALRDMDVVKAAFFRDEEIGCVGAKAAKMDFFNDVSFVMEADRQGNTDVVVAMGRTDIAGKDFLLAAAPVLERFDRVQTRDGRPTDVITLKENGLNVSAVNISCGYYAPHSDYETVSPWWANHAYGFIRDMFNTLGHQRWEHVVPPVVVHTPPKNIRVPSWWPDEGYYDTLFWEDPDSLERAWMDRALVRREAILERNSVPYTTGNQTGLLTVDLDQHKLAISEWVVSRNDKHVVKRVKKILDIFDVACPCCQYIGSLHLDMDDDFMTARVVCLFCGVDDVVIVGGQQFVGDFLTKERSGLEQGVLALLEGDYVDQHDDETLADKVRSNNVTPMIHNGWDKHRKKKVKADLGPV